MDPSVTLLLKVLNDIFFLIYTHHPQNNRNKSSRFVSTDNWLLSPLRVVLQPGKIEPTRVLLLHSVATQWRRMEFRIVERLVRSLVQNGSRDPCAHSDWS